MQIIYQYVVKHVDIFVIVCKAHLNNEAVRPDPDHREGHVVRLRDHGDAFRGLLGHVTYAVLESVDVVSCNSRCRPRLDGRRPQTAPGQRFESELRSRVFGM